jgi:lysozyme
LHDDLEETENFVNALVTVPLTQNQFDALCAIVFNCGPGPLQKTMGRRLNERDYEGAAKEFDYWVHDNGQAITGLRNRRAAEKTLFLQKD